MNIKASELKAYMENNELERLVVEVVNQEVPQSPYQKPRTLAKRLVILSVRAQVYITYSMYNSFKRGACTVPADFEFILLEGEDEERILKEYDEHGGGLEKAFRETFKTVNPQIQEKVKAAVQLLNEIEALSEKHGLPFTPSADLGGRMLSYTPQSFREKFGEMDVEIVEQITNTYAGAAVGWLSSSQNC